MLKNSSYSTSILPREAAALHDVPLLSFYVIYAPMLWSRQLLVPLNSVASKTSNTFTLQIGKNEKKKKKKEKINPKRFIVLRNADHLLGDSSGLVFPAGKCRFYKPCSH